MGKEIIVQAEQRKTVESWKLNSTMDIPGTRTIANCQLHFTDKSEDVKEFVLWENETYNPNWSDVDVTNKLTEILG